MGAEGHSSSQIDSLFSPSQLPALRNLRIGSMRVQHSRIQLYKYQQGSSDVRKTESVFGTEENAWIPSKEVTTRATKLEADENWSLVDLLSRSASAKSDRRSKSSKSLLVASDTHRSQGNPEAEGVKRNVPSFLQSGTNRGGARLWRRHDLRLSKGLPLNESHEDTDAETDDNCEESEYNCRMSSGSSISWAEDAVEAEQSEHLAKLWNDVEVACAGEQRPEKMSDEVYEECLLWRRAFPVESSMRPNRFASMEEFLTGIEEDVTPTNDISTLTEKSRYTPQSSMSLQSRFPDGHEYSIPNAETTTDFVSSWLFNCQQYGNEKFPEKEVPNSIQNQSDDYSKGFHPSPEESGNPKSSGKTRRHQRALAQPLPFSPPVHSGLTASPVPMKTTGTRKQETARCGSPINVRNHSAAFKSNNLPELGEWTPAPAHERNDTRELQVKVSTGTVGVHKPFGRKSSGIERPCRLPIPIQKEDRFSGRHNSAKPFLLWVFDRVSPSS